MDSIERPQKLNLGIHDRYQIPKFTQESIEELLKTDRTILTRNGSLSSRSGSKQIIIGDFNIDQSKSSSLKSMREIFNLTQIITDPTREARGSSTLIDHIYVNQLQFQRRVADRPE